MQCHGADSVVLFHLTNTGDHLPGTFGTTLVISHHVTLLKIVVRGLKKITEDRGVLLTGAGSYITDVSIDLIMASVVDTRSLLVPKSIGMTTMLNSTLCFPHILDRNTEANLQ